MFNFLNSAVLVAAAAALIPLLIHLFSKRKVKIVEFSSLKHLKEMQKRQVRRLKIRQILLLLLRMLIILAAVLAFARPASQGGYIGSHAGVSSVILLDRSASMHRQVKDGRLFDLAKKSAEDILKNFGEGDEVIVIPFDREPYFPAGERFYSRETAENILSSTTAGYYLSEPVTAIKKAGELLSRTKNLNKELYLITDRQMNSTPAVADSSLAGVKTYLVDLPTETDGNCGVIDVDMGGQLIEIGSAFNIHAKIKNYDSFDKPGLLASLFIDGVRVMQSEFTSEARNVNDIQFSHTLYNPGFHQGWVELSDDGFPPDNRFYFSFGLPEQFNVLIIDGDNTGDLIRLALVPSEKLARYWSIKITPPENFPGLKLNDYDVVIYCGLAEPDALETSRLLKYIDDGGGLFYIAGGNINKDLFNSALGTVLDLKYTQAIPAFFSGAGYYSLGQFDYDHPVFKAFETLQRDSLPTLRFYVLPEIEIGSQSRRLASFSNGTPALVETAYGLGRILFLAAPINPRYTDLPSHSFFVPFIIRIAEYLAGSVAEYEIKNYTGQNMTRVISGRKRGYGQATMITPDNRAYDIAGNEKAEQLTFDCRPIDIPGIYQIQSSRGLVDMFPVNLPPEESDLGAVEIGELAQIWHLSDCTILPYESGSESVIKTSRFGRELWKIFIWLAVILVAVEMLVSREKGAEAIEP